MRTRLWRSVATHVTFQRTRGWWTPISPVRFASISSCCRVCSFFAPPARSFVKSTGLIAERGLALILGDGIVTCLSAPA